MEFEWDPRKAEENKSKRGVGFHTMNQEVLQILKPIPLALDPGEVISGLKLRAPDAFRQALDLVAIARPLISAQAAFKVSYIDEKLEDALIMDGVRFESRVLRKNLESLGRVFPYIVTIGDGLENRANETADLLEKYYLDAIGNIALRKAREQLHGHLRDRFALGAISYMSPGSLPDWPIEEQRPLFEVLSGVESSIGVILTEHYLMLPRKSVSGIFFPTEVSFHSCQLCPRKRCEGRKSPYDEDLAREYGIGNPALPVFADDGDGRKLDRNKLNSC